MSSTTPANARYFVGIDLGTTHTVVAFTDISQGINTDQLAIFEIEQLVAAGEVAKRPMLPSFRYHPTKGELAPQDLVLPWIPSPVQGEIKQLIIGEWARELGSKVDGRLVCSAKSWLSHLNVDRSAAILPWEAADGVEKVSPVVASASYLNHVRQAWDHEHPNDLLQDQQLVITVPASFDEVARTLTVEAAKLAGLNNILLLEEPQAVCYAWYANNRDQASQLLANIKLLLVCDVGGGTTDLSLIRVTVADNANDEPLCLTRVGVGDHLMLGGDNIDLALAYHAEQRITGKGNKLNTASLSQLIQQTRKAKELLLANEAPESATVTVLGSGSRLIGGAKSCQLSRDEVQTIALDGFMPISELDQHPSQRSSAMIEFGLPYASDPAISKHIAQFISRHQSACQQALNTPHLAAVPDGLLLNGGIFNSPLLQQRSVDLLSHWRKASINCLANTSPDLAVAYGAVAYSMARAGAQLKIGGGSARSYFLRIDKATSESSTDDSSPSQGICLLAKGQDEGEEVELNSRRFLLRVGQPVNFHLVSSSSDNSYQAGDIFDIDTDHFVSLPPLIAALETNPNNDSGIAQQDEIEVRLVSTLTAVGTLKIDCVSVNNSQQRWQLEFQIRRDLAQLQQPQHNLKQLPTNFSQVVEKLDAVYGQSQKQVDPKAVKTLRNDLEKLLGKREEWDIVTLRAVFDHLLSNASKRRRSETHERNWFTLAGFCLRPGFGATLDDWRIDQIWPLYEQGLQYAKEIASWTSWWTFWRRAAGGLNDSQQQQLFNDISIYIDPAALTKRKLIAELKNKSYEDMVRLVATLEQLSANTKAQLGDWLLERLKKSSETPTSWWALGRLGTRIPFHGSAHNVIATDNIYLWLKPLLKTDWKKNTHAAFAAVMLTRMSGDRSRDIDEHYRQLILDKLEAIKAPGSWLKMITEVIQLDDIETKRVFGEALPSGLKLID